MSGFTWGWLLIGGAVLVLEGVALFNSRRGDTLSEHVWAWLGTGAYDRVARRRPGVQGGAEPPFIVAPWTLRLARFALIAGMVWLGLHFTTGGWV